MIQTEPRDRLAVQGSTGPSARTDTGMRDPNQVRPQTYDITFSGEAGPAIRAEFDDCQVTVGSGATTLRAELPDQAALIGLLLRITALGFELTGMRLAEAPSGGD